MHDAPEQSTAMTRLADRVSARSTADRVAAYRAAGWWRDSRLSDGVEAAAAAPDSLAVVDNAVTLTYGELASRVGAAMGRLRSIGIGPGDPVLLISGNTAAAVVAYHAIIRAGAVVALLDRRCGPADVTHAREALGGRLTIVVAHAEGERLVDTEAAECRTIDLDDLTANGASGAGPPVSWPEPARDRPAVVLFTSGTTGRPKGVVHSLDTLTAGAANMARICMVDPGTVTFLISPLSSSAGVMQMHVSADNHTTLVLEDRFEPAAALERMEAVGATLLGGAPAIAERLVRAAVEADRRVPLRTLALGGAMLPRPLLDLATDRFGIEIVRVYGSSEAPNFSGSLPDDPRDRRLSDDGALMPGSEVRIGSVDHPQEGLLRGPGLFLGYLDPADDVQALDDGWFRTGDLIEVADGRLTVVGRLKEVVNRNGLKISLGEIDAALAGLPGGVEMACFTVPDPETGERLAVAARFEPDVTVRLADVVAHLVAAGTARRKLPEQLVVWEEPLPRTPTGKVVRSRLVMEAASKTSELAPRLR